MAPPTPPPAAACAAALRCTTWTTVRRRPRAPRRRSPGPGPAGPRRPGGRPCPYARRGLPWPGPAGPRMAAPDPAAPAPPDPGRGPRSVLAPCDDSCACSRSSRSSISAPSLQPTAAVSLHEPRTAQEVRPGIANQQVDSGLPRERRRSQRSSRCCPQGRCGQIGWVRHERACCHQYTLTTASPLPTKAAMAISNPAEPQGGRHSISRSVRDQRGRPCSPTSTARSRRCASRCLACGSWWSRPAMPSGAAARSIAGRQGASSLLECSRRWLYQPSSGAGGCVCAGCSTCRLDIVVV
jgi:hypothetical protein